MPQFRKHQGPEPEQLAPDKGYVGLEEAARHLHIHAITLKKIIKERKVTCTVIGKRYRFKISDLNDYLERATRHAIDTTEE